MTSLDRRHVRAGSLLYVILGAILLSSLALNFNNLGHPAVKDLDEAYHAIVARSMLDDPFKPTLYATPYLPYVYTNWQSNHVWLHKPPVALWQIAASFSVFGESNFTLRLPSAILSTAAVALTFLIGRKLVSSEAALIATALQAFAPAITRLVHGQVFSDHVDIAMLFWTEAAMYLLIRVSLTGMTTAAILAGIAQSIAWMTKSYPAGFITVVAIALYLEGRVLRTNASLRFSGRQLIAMVLASVITALPWTIWCLAKYPNEFIFEQFRVFSHLQSDVENFAAPWDRLLADYLQRGLFEWYAVAIVSTIYVTIDAIRRRESNRFVIAVWAWSVLLPHVLATSKTPTATLIGWPAAWLAIGALGSDAIRRRPFALGAMIAAGILLIIWPLRPLNSVMGYGENYHFGFIAMQHWPIAASAAAIAIAGCLSGWLSHRRDPAISESPTARGRGSPLVVPFVLAVLFSYPAYRYVHLAIAVSRDVPTDAVAFPKLGQFVRAKAPANAVFLVDVQQRGEAVIAMWWLDRACYPLHEASLTSDVATIVANGGQPFILSRRSRPETPLPGVVGEAQIFVPPVVIPLPVRSTTNPAGT